MSLSEQFNVGVRLKTALGTTSVSLSQTSAAASTGVNGQTIDRNTSGYKRYYSCKAALVASFVASSSQRTATVAVNVEHSSDGTSWDSYTTGTAATFGSTNGTTHYQTAETNVNLNGARRYIRMVIGAPTYADCSSGQGVFSGAGVVVFGGADTLPA
jgi:hypothetical protein